MHCISASNGTYNNTITGPMQRWLGYICNYILSSNHALEFSTVAIIIPFCCIRILSAGGSLVATITLLGSWTMLSWSTLPSPSDRISASKIIDCTARASASITVAAAGMVQKVARSVYMRAAVGGGVLCVQTVRVIPWGCPELWIYRPGLVSCYKLYHRVHVIWVIAPCS